mmetsp:Transcript_90101/g.226770  ORF Transcript_90101/g.226770 Transcript_90101/m.226770 type:complete len:221 (+) Transcript_90101:192-854(+)
MRRSHRMERRQHVGHMPHILRASSDGCHHGHLGPIRRRCEVSHAGSLQLARCGMADSGRGTIVLTPRWRISQVHVDPVPRLLGSRRLVARIRSAGGGAESGVHHTMDRSSEPIVHLCEHLSRLCCHHFRQLLGAHLHTRSSHVYHAREHVLLAPLRCGSLLRGNQMGGGLFAHLRACDLHQEKPAVPFQDFNKVQRHCAHELRIDGVLGRNIRLALCFAQ